MDTTQQETAKDFKTQAFEEHWTTRGNVPKIITLEVQQAPFIYFII